jgi:mono/diheme cytochrome c family protein
MTMKTTKPVLPILLPLLLLYPVAAPADSERGRLLYENHCRSCHESNVHIRQTQAAKSLKALRAEVVRWQETLALQWRSEEVGDVTEYLNATWYHYAE